MLCSWYYIMVMELSGMQFGLKCEQALLYLGERSKPRENTRARGRSAPRSLCPLVRSAPRGSVLGSQQWLGKKKIGTLGTVDSVNLTKLKNPLACKIFDTMISLIPTYNSDEHITGVCLPNQICRYTRDTWCSRYTRYSRYSRYKGGELFGIHFTSYIKAYNTCFGDSEDTHQE